MSAPAPPLRARGPICVEISAFRSLTNIHNLALETLWAAPPLPDHERLWAAFLEGYEERRPLAAIERDAIPLSAALRPLGIMEWIAGRTQRSHDMDTWPPAERNGLPGGDQFDRALRFLRAWETTYL